MVRVQVVLGALALLASSCGAAPGPLGGLPKLLNKLPFRRSPRELPEPPVPVAGDLGHTNEEDFQEPSAPVIAEQIVDNLAPTGSKQRCVATIGRHRRMCGREQHHVLF